MARKKASKKKETESTKVDSRAIDAEKLDETLWNGAEDFDQEFYEDAEKLYPKIVKCYENKQEQMDRIEEYWSIYNAQPDENQQYSGNSLCYVPAVRDCINARIKRTLAQLYPANYKHVDAVGPTGETPYAQMSLLEHYIRHCHLKDIVRADLLAGDVTGHWNLYIDWTKSTRRVTEVIKKPPMLTSADGEIEAEDVTVDEEYETKSDEVIDEGPDIVPFATEDLAVYPPTCNSVEDATATCIRLRMSKEKLEQLVDEGVFIGTTAKELIDKVAKPSGGREKYVPPKKRTADAGVRTEGTYKYALIYEVHTNLDIGEGYKEPVYIYYAGQNEILGIIKNPFWCGKRPIISAPIERVEGSFFGVSKIEPVKYMQWNLNDFFNMGQDSAQYALMPIVMTDPLAQPNYQSMTMGLAAIWLANPQTTQFAQFPALWKDSIQLCAAMKQQIQESMDVNEAMLGKAPAGRKNQAQQAAQAQSQEMNIVDHAKRYEEVMLNPLLERIFEMDRQFRTKELVIATMGEVGTEKRLQEIPPQAFGERYFFRWSGTSFQMGMQRIQQMISWMNVLRGIPPQQLNGRRLDVTPILEYGTGQIFGVEVAPKILVDDRNLFHVEPNEENLMMHNGLAAQVHEADDDARHIAEHQHGAVLTGDPVGLFRAHIQQHQQAMQIKQQKAQGAQQPGGAQGVPGGAGPGVAGTPRPGAQPGQPRPQQPPGAVHPDQMADPQAMPR
jgi:hypothetical protein